MDAEHGHRFFRSWLPLAREAGPYVTVFLAMILVVTTWWLVGHLTDCVEQNRLMTTRIVEQQRQHSEQLALLWRCPPAPAPR